MQASYAEREEYANHRPSEPQPSDARLLIYTSPYTTTVHAINSAVIKLSALTKVSVVYRGISGRRLPQKLLTKDEYGVSSGVESEA